LILFLFEAEPSLLERSLKNKKRKGT
jgi:hypothetical protein